MKGVKFLAKGFLEAVVPPAKGETFLWSSELPGWGLRVSCTGKRSWIVQCRIDGQSRRTTIGDVRLKSPIQARDRARAILAAAEDNRDLLADEAAAEAAAKERQEMAEERAIGKLARLYLADPETRAKRSYGDIEHYLLTVWQEVHDESAETIDRDRLGHVLEGIALTRGKPTGNRARSQLSALFDWALVRGWPDPEDRTRRVKLRREANPVRYLHKWAETSRDRVLDPQELGAVWRLAPTVTETFGAVMRLLILTGCRKTEIAELRRREVDFERAEIRLPKHRVKNARAHVVPLVPRAVEILRAQPETSSPLVFGSFAWSHVKRKLDALLAAEREREGLPPMQPWVIHDIRRSFVTGLNEHICPDDPSLIEVLVNHLSGIRAGVAGTYNRSQRLEARRRALEAWAELVLRAAGEAVEPARVVRLR